MLHNVKTPTTIAATPAARRTAAPSGFPADMARRLADVRVATACLLALLVFSVATAPARAQFEEEEPDGFGDVGAAAAAPAAVAPANAGEDAVALNDFALSDPVVAAVLDLPRATPSQRLTAILSLVDLGRTDVAAALLPSLLTANLDDSQRADLVREFGPARFLQLVRLDAPAAEGAASALPGVRDFAQKCLDAASALERDPARIAKILEQLNAPAEEDRYAARVDLRATGEPGIIAALHALAVAPTPAARGNIMAALGDLRPTLDAPLLAMLAEGAGQARADAATLAGQLRTRSALPFLAALAVSTDPAARAAQGAISGLGLAAPTPAEAQELVRREIAELDAAPLVSDELIAERWWSWDAAGNQPVATEFPAAQRRILARARLAQALVDAGGQANPADQRLALIDALEAAQLLGRELPPTMAAAWSGLTPSDLSTALGTAVREKRFAAAAHIAAELGARGDVSVLSTADGRPAPLAAALTSPVRDLRLAALAAVMQLNPRHTFPGASHVPAALWYFAAAGGDPYAVVAAPIFPRASDWAGEFRRLGYEAMPAATGREALVAAVDRSAAPRLAVILLDADIGQPLMQEVVFQLRSAAPTADVPIVLAASIEQLPHAERIAAADPLVLAVPRPRGQAVFDDVVKRALALDAHPLADKATRTKQAGQALEWIAALLAEAAPYDELRRDGRLVNRTLYIPELAAASIRVLGQLGTAESQSLLTDYASSRSAPIERRRQAADALAASFGRFGIQLTNAQRLLQYDRYNASETADADTQQVLGRILDALEQKK
jgi:hypothetical protein